MAVIKRGAPAYKKINPIVTDPIGNGLQDRASDAMVRHRATRAPLSSMGRPVEFGSLIGGAPDLQG